MTPEVRAIVARAHAMAGELGASSLEIWRAIVDEEVVVDVLATCHVDVPQLRAWLEAAVRNRWPLRGPSEVDAWIERFEKMKPLDTKLLLGRLLTSPSSSFVIAWLVESGVAAVDIVTYLAHGIVPVAEPRAQPPRAWVTKGWSEPRSKGLYDVVMYNDDFTTYEFVAHELSAVFGVPGSEARALAETIHRDGRAVVATGPLDAVVATIDEVTRSAREAGYPLRLTFEPAD